MRKLLGTLALGGMLAFAAPVEATPQQALVNVEVGDVTILENVNIGIAANVAAQICGVQVGPIAVLATQVVRTQQQRTACEIEQNGEVQQVIISPS